MFISWCNYYVFLIVHYTCEEVNLIVQLVWWFSFHWYQMSSLHCEGKLQLTVMEWALLCAAVRIRKLIWYGSSYPHHWVNLAHFQNQHYSFFLSLIFLEIHLHCVLWWSAQSLLAELLIKQQPSEIKARKESSLHQRETMGPVCSLKLSPVRAGW